MNIQPMVYDHIDKTGMWFKGTKNGFWYVLYWNPFLLLKTLITGNAVIGFFPFKTKHIKNVN